MKFGDFFRAAWGYDAFPWQERLAEAALAGNWPEIVGLPTAAGKTAVIDVAVFALALGAPGAGRRIFFVVNRRVIVDEAAERAQALAKKLEEAAPESVLGQLANALTAIGHGGDSKPLGVAVLRGGIVRDRFWTRSPLQPIVVCSTVDQIGSSLLFRAYETGENGWPIRAGLAAQDSLIILDEAHTSRPFASTLSRIRQFQCAARENLAPPLSVVRMSATPGAAESFRENQKDLTDPVLARRWHAEKRARLVLEDAGADPKPAPPVQSLAREARRMRDEAGAKVIGVVVNRVQTARDLYGELGRDEGTDVILLTGRARAWDRDRIWRKWAPSIAMGRKTPPATPIFVVATQCIEVGANIDFDGLVTEIASVDALEQRFGRLNREGREGVAPAAIVACRAQVAARAEDPIYGKAITATWQWLKSRSGNDPEATSAGQPRKRRGAVKGAEVCQMGVLTLRQDLAACADLDALLCPSSDGPVLMPAHLDLLSQTSPVPSVVPEPTLYLHGPQAGPADVQIVWRADLTGPTAQWRKVIEISPPSAAEAISVPVWAAREWLARRTVGEMPDLEGVPAPPVTEDLAPGRPVLRYRSAGESELIEGIATIRPGMLVVAPASYGGCDEWGWDPEFEGAVTDIGDAVKADAGKPTLRLNPILARSHGYQKLAEGLRDCESNADARRFLALAKADAGEPAWLRGAISALASAGKLIEDPGDESWAAVASRTDANETVWSSDREVPLDEHLAGCGAWAKRFACHLPRGIAETVACAAVLHDIGKADPRFQAWLAGGNPTAPGRMLAKSRRSAQNAGAIERARVLAGYPKGGRHELTSVALAESAMPADMDPDLLLHLIGAHHGRCRPFAPVIADPSPAEVKFRGWAASSCHGLESAASGVAERFWRLTQRYGWYGLAYLETIVRLADHRQSEEEQNPAPGKSAVTTSA